MSKTGFPKTGSAIKNGSVRPGPLAGLRQIGSFIRSSAVDACTSVYSFGCELVGRRQRQERAEQGEDGLTLELTTEDLQRINRCYEESRRNAERAQLGYLRDSYGADMRRVEAALRQSRNRKEISRLEKRWRWLNSKLCEIDKRERHFKGW